MAYLSVYLCFVWSHPCWYLNTIGKQMANFELLDQICVCLCLLNSQTVNDESINIQQRSFLWKSPEQNRPLLPKYALKSTRAKNFSLPLVLFWFPLVGTCSCSLQAGFPSQQLYLFSLLLPTNAQRLVSPNADPGSALSSHSLCLSLVIDPLTGKRGWVGRRLTELSVV